MVDVAKIPTCDEDGCEKIAVARMKGKFLCAGHLNPPISKEYLAREREYWCGVKSSMRDVEDNNPGPPSFTQDERRRMGT